MKGVTAFLKSEHFHCLLSIRKGQKQFTNDAIFVELSLDNDLAPISTPEASCFKATTVINKAING